MNITATTNIGANVTRHNAVIDAPLQRPGKSGDAVGQRAMMDIAKATLGETGPRNIQGEVASALARSLSIDSILALQQPTDAQDAVAPVDVTPVAGAADPPEVNREG